MFQIFDGRDLLNEPARNPGQYARNLLRILFTSEELQSSLLPTTQSKRYLKPELDKDRMDLLNGSVFDFLLSITNRLYFSFVVHRCCPYKISHRSISL